MLPSAHQTLLVGTRSNDDEDGEENPDAEYDHDENVISIFYPKMRSKQHVIMSLIHEYTHYLQSPSWHKRYYTMGYNYFNHPYEVAALEAEKFLSH